MNALDTLGERIAPANGQRAPGADDLALRDEAVATSVGLAG